MVPVIEKVDTMRSGKAQRKRKRILFGQPYPKIEQMMPGTVFHTIRFIDKLDYYRQLADERAEVDIWLTTIDDSIGVAEVFGVAVCNISDIDDKMARADTYKNWNTSMLFKLLERFYWRKDDWNGKNSKVVVVFLLTVESAIQHF